MEALMIIGGIIALILFIAAGVALHTHSQTQYGKGVFRLGPLIASAVCIVLGLIGLGLTDDTGAYTLNGIVVLSTAGLILATLLMDNISKTNPLIGSMATVYQISTSIVALALLVLVANALNDRKKK